MGNLNLAFKPILYPGPSARSSKATRSISRASFKTNFFYCSCCFQTIYKTRTFWHLSCPNFKSWSALRLRHHRHHHHHDHHNHHDADARDHEHDPLMIGTSSEAWSALVCLLIQFQAIRFISQKPKGKALEIGLWSFNCFSLASFVSFLFTKQSEGSGNHELMCVGGECLSF